MIIGAELGGGAAQILLIHESSRLVDDVQRVQHLDLKLDGEYRQKYRNSQLYTASAIISTRSVL